VTISSKPAAGAYWRQLIFSAAMKSLRLELIEEH
jgi:hypothetical protein